MSAETLREAARLMRERAQYAPSGQWASDDWGEVVSDKQEPPEGDLSSYYFGAAICRVDDSDRDDEGVALLGEYIASWPPAVALAVADLLDGLADVLPFGDDGQPLILAGSTYHRAFAVARAYLGESA